MKRIKLVPKAVAAVNDANSERLRMLEEDAEEEEENHDAHSSVDRFRESRRSIVSRRTSRSLHTALTSSSFSEFFLISFLLLAHRTLSFFLSFFLLPSARKLAAQQQRSHPFDEEDLLPGE